MCFDFKCKRCAIDRKSATCRHFGGQHQEAYVIIEVSLNDGKSIFIKGFYPEAGYVEVTLNNVEYRFYLMQFEEFFKGWLEDEKETDRVKYFIAGDCWTYEEGYDELIDGDEDYNDSEYYRRKCFRGKIDEFTEEHVSKCIRADKDLNLPSDKDKLKAEIKELETEMKEMRKKLKTLRATLKESQ